MTVRRASDSTLLPRPDLRNTPLQNSESILYVDGSSSRTSDGSLFFGYGICTDLKLQKVGNCLTIAQPSRQRSLPWHECAAEPKVKPLQFIQTLTMHMALFTMLVPCGMSGGL